MWGEVVVRRLSSQKRAKVLAALVEGCSIRSTVRMTGVAKNTITKLLVDVGEACEQYQAQTLVDLPCKRIEVDEIWAYVGCKEKAKNAGAKGDGDVWTWAALDPDSKLVVSWLVGGRGADAATVFLQDLAGRLSQRVQLTSDGHPAYLEAVPNAFGRSVDYAQLVKQYGMFSNTDRRYSPSKVHEAWKTPLIGRPRKKDICTSHVERQNLTMRMCIRRFTRLTNGFSKKVENHCAAVALHFMYYNFCRVHQSIGTTPAIEAGVADHRWSLEEIVGLLEADEGEQIEMGALKRGRYRKRVSN